MQCHINIISHGQNIRWAQDRVTQILCRMDNLTWKHYHHVLTLQSHEHGVTWKHYHHTLTPVTWA